MNDVFWAIMFGTIFVAIIFGVVLMSAEQAQKDAHHAEYYECANGKGYKVSYFDNVMCIDKNIVLESRK